MCPLQLLVRYAAMMMTTLLLAGAALASAPRPPLASAPRPPLAPRLLLNDTLVTSLNLTEGKTETLAFYLHDIPDGFVGELSIQISSLDGIEHFKISPDNFTVNDNVTTADPPPTFPHDALPLNGTSGDIPYVNRVTGIPKSGEDAAGYLPLDARAGSGSGRYLQGEFEASGVLVGFASFRFVLRDGNGGEPMESAPVDVKVDIGYHMMDKIFMYVVILLITILYINMGCTIDIAVIRQCLRRPVALTIGLSCQYLFMPLCSYLLGYLLLSANPALFLGLFVTGCSPGGGASNVWTLLLGGSLDISVTMTFLSTVAAFGMMPLWMWALAPSIFEDGHFDSPPYFNMAMMVLCLIIPISIGLVLQRFCPKAASLLARLLKPLSVVFIIFVMTFGMYAYWYIFKFFTWRVALCGFLLPFLGFLFGGSMSGLCRRPLTEVIAISVETGLQNTGLSIILLKVALASFSPLGEVAMVVPVAVATFTPIPLMVAYCVVLCRGYLKRSRTPDDGGRGEYTSVPSE